MKTTTYGVAAAASLIAGCGGGGNADPPAQSPGGIWIGADSATGLQVTALIDENGNFDVIRSDNGQFYGTLSVSGNAISSSIDGVAPFGSAFPDGSLHGTGTVAGTLTERSHISASVKFTTDAGETTTTTVNMSFHSIYMHPANVPALAGTYTDTASGVVINVDSGGIIFAQDPATGCVVNGQILAANSGYSVYAPTIKYANCQGSAASLNGREFAGLAMFDSTTRGTALVGLRDQSGHPYGLVFSLTRS
jgi:hypothetical protein